MSSRALLALLASDRVASGSKLGQNGCWTICLPVNKGMGPASRHGSASSLLYGDC